MGGLGRSVPAGTWRSSLDPAPGRLSRHPSRGGNRNGPRPTRRWATTAWLRPPGPTRHGRSRPWARPWARSRSPATSVRPRPADAPPRPPLRVDPGHTRFGDGPLPYQGRLLRPVGDLGAMSRPRQRSGHGGLGGGPVSRGSPGDTLGRLGDHRCGRRGGRSGRGAITAGRHSVVRRHTFRRHLGYTLVDHPGHVTPARIVQTVLDHLEGQEVLPLLAEHPAKPLHIVVVELAVAGRGPLRIDQALALEEPDLGDGHIREFLPQEGQDITDGEVGPAAHGATPPTQTTPLIELRRSSDTAAERPPGIELLIRLSPPDRPV